MNWFHRQVCRSGPWRRRLEKQLLPWVLQGVELGDDVLEIGPGPGITTDLACCAPVVSSLASTALVLPFSG